MMKKYYRLLKDLPTFKAGSHFELRDDGCLWLASRDVAPEHWKENVMAYHKHTLEHFPNILEEWFEEVEWPVNWDYYYYIGCDGAIRGDEFHAGSEDERQKEFGNVFRTYDEAVRAYRRVKAVLEGEH